MLGQIDTPKPKRSLLSYILIGVVIVVVLLGINFAYLVKNESVKISAKPTNTNTSITPTSTENKLTTYYNEVLGVSFKYPASWGPVTEDFSKPEDTNIITGKMATIFFSKRPDFSIEVLTLNLTGSYIPPVFTEKNSSEICKRYNMGNLKALQGCVLKQLGTTDYAWINELTAPECSPDYTTKVYAVHTGNEFEDLIFTARLPDATKKVTELYDCVDTNKQASAVAEADRQSFNINNDKNLSLTDKAVLKDFTNILASLEFTK